MEMNTSSFRSSLQGATLEGVDPSWISDLCDEYNLQPKVFYLWQKQFFENGAAAFVRDNDRAKRDDEQLIQKLEEKLRRKHEVLSELMEETSS
jgi:hypothetical protein